MRNFAEFKSKLKHPQQVALFELIESILGNGQALQGNITRICSGSGYTPTETKKLLSAMVASELVELKVRKSPATMEPRIHVVVCEGVLL